MISCNHMLLYIVDKIPTIDPDVKIDILGNVNMEKLISRLSLYSPAEKNPDPSKAYFCYAEDLASVSKNYRDIILICINNSNALPSVNEALNALIFTTKYKLPYVFNSMQNLLYNIDISYTNIYRSILENKDLQETILIAARIITNPFLLLDADFRLLGWSKYHVCEDPFYQETVANASLSSNHILWFLAENMLSKLAKHGKILLPAGNHLSDSPLFIRMLKDNDIVLGYGIMVCSILAPRPPMMQGFSDFIDQIGTRLTNKSNKRWNIQQEHTHFLVDLINGRLKRTEEIQNYANTLNISASGNFHLYLILFNNIDNIPLNYAFDTFKLLVKEPLCFLYKEGIVVIIDDSRKEIHEERRSQYLKFLDDFSASCSISSSFLNLAELPKEYKQAICAYELGKMFASTVKPLYYKYSNKIFDYLRYTECEVIRNYKESTGWFPIHFPKLLQLIREDQEKGTNYARTLFCYLTNERHVSNTAREMYLHRNSIINRIERIQEFMSIDLNDYNMRITLMLAFRVIDYATAAGMDDELFNLSI